MQRDNIVVGRMYNVVWRKQRFIFKFQYYLIEYIWVNFLIFLIVIKWMFYRFYFVFKELNYIYDDYL